MPSASKLFESTAWPSVVHLSSSTITPGNVLTKSVAYGERQMQLTVERRVRRVRRPTTPRARSAPYHYLGSAVR